MTPRQTTFGEYAANTPGWPPCGRDEWGPTTRRPVPDAERGRLKHAPAVPVDRRELHGTGLAPSDFEIVAGVCSPKTAREQGYHPDDEHREDHYPDDEHREDHYPDDQEAATAADLERVDAWEAPRC